MAVVGITGARLGVEDARRGTVSPAKPTPEAKRKKATHRTENGLPLHSLETLDRRARHPLPQHLPDHFRSERAHRATAHPAHQPNAGPET